MPLCQRSQADSRELRAEVRSAIESLGERQRLAVMLAKFEHLGYAEIGQVMGIQPQAVKSLLARARENLRAALSPYLERGESLGPASPADSLLEQEELP